MLTQNGIALQPTNCSASPHPWRIQNRKKGDVYNASYPILSHPISSEANDNAKQADIN